MKTVDVYEVSRSVRTTSADYLDFISIPRLDLREWTEARLESGHDCDLESPAYVRHSQPIMQLRQSGRPDTFVAIGPELFELLAPAVNYGMHKKLEGMEHASKQMLAVNAQLNQAIDREKSNASLQALTAQYLSERIGNFCKANVLTRIWRAIRKSL